MSASSRKRIPYIDWMRGLACVGMFVTHCYDSWLGGAAREGRVMVWSQLGGTLPAPLFLFLAGLALGLLTDSLREKGIAASQIARRTIWRGTEILGLALLFRFQEFLLGQPGAPWMDLFRVDILNVIGVSIILMGATCGIVGAAGGLDLGKLRARNMMAAGAIAAGIILLTPPLWTTWAPHWRAWWLESYINGVHTFGIPQTWLFPVFPWAAFAFAGLAAGFLLRGDWLRRHDAAVPIVFAAGGLALAGLGYALDAGKVQLYAQYDFWHTSPNFFLIRLGIVLLAGTGAYYWCRWTAAGQRFSPLIEMGRCSLLIYWVHIEFVYGRVSILPKHELGVGMATIGLLVIFVCSVLLAIARNRFSDWGATFSSFMPRDVSVESPSE